MKQYEPLNFIFLHDYCCQIMTIMTFFGLTTKVKEKEGGLGQEKCPRTQTHKCMSCIPTFPNNFSHFGSWSPTKSWMYRTKVQIINCAQIGLSIYYWFFFSNVDIHYKLGNWQVFLPSIPFDKPKGVWMA